LPTTSLPGKLPLNGIPSGNPAIFKQIASEVREQFAIEFSEREVYNLLSRFFMRMRTHMKLGNFINIKYLGAFGVTSREKKHREKIDYAIIERKIHNKRNREYKKGRRHDIKVRYLKHCDMRKEKGLKPWTFADWQQVFKVYMPPAKSNFFRLKVFKHQKKFLSLMKER